MQSRMELQAEAGLFGLSSGEGPGLRRNGAATRPKAGSIGKHEADQGTLLGLLGIESEEAVVGVMGPELGERFAEGVKIPNDQLIAGMRHVSAEEPAKLAVEQREDFQIAAARAHRLIEMLMKPPVALGVR